jgi:hypothetical protein
MSNDRRMFEALGKLLEISSHPDYLHEDDKEIDTSWDYDDTEMDIRVNSMDVPF